MKWFQAKKGQIILLKIVNIFHLQLIKYLEIQVKEDLRVVVYVINYFKKKQDFFLLNNDCEMKKKFMNILSGETESYNK